MTVEKNNNTKEQYEHALRLYAMQALTFKVLLTEEVQWYSDAPCQQQYYEQGKPNFTCLSPRTTPSLVIRPQQVQVAGLTAVRI